MSGTVVIVIAALIGWCLLSVALALFVGASASADRAARRADLGAPGRHQVCPATGPDAGRLSGPLPASRQSRGCAPAASVPRMKIRSDSTALITGAASGFGAAVARRLTAAGARVRAGGRRRAGGRAVAEEVGGLFVRCDVRKPEDSVQAVEAAEQEYGRLDIAFLNAGVASREHGSTKSQLEEYTRVVEINLGGVFFGAQAVLPALRGAGGGAIVATASLAGLHSDGHRSALHADQACGRRSGALARRAVQGRGHHGQRDLPGFADTKIIAEHVQDFRDAGFPLLTAEEVAEVVHRLIAADETGQAWPIQPGRGTRSRTVSAECPGPRVVRARGPGAAGGARVMRRVRAAGDRVSSIPIAQAVTYSRGAEPRTSGRTSPSTSPTGLEGLQRRADQWRQVQPDVRGEQHALARSCCAGRRCRPCWRRRTTWAASTP